MAKSKPRAFETADGLKLLCCIKNVFVYIDKLTGALVLSKHEVKTLRPINNVEWSYGKTWGINAIPLTEQQIVWALKALTEREEFLKNTNEQLLFLEFDSLSRMSIEDSFNRLSYVLKAFSGESVEVKNMLATKIFRGNFPTIGLYTPEQKQELIEAYRLYNSNLDTGLAQLINWVEKGVKRERIKSFAK